MKISLVAAAAGMFVILSLNLGGPALAQARPAAPVQVIMTVDWEGEDMTTSTLGAMQAFRQDYPQLPILHYLNAAYYTKPNADADQVTAAISSVLLPQDQLGLHIHAWKSLFNAAGVKFRNSPNWNPGGKPLEGDECAYDCGHSIPISVYTKAEMNKVIAFSTKTLAAHGFGQAVHFRSGGWMLSQNVADALTANGFVTDSSAVPAEFLRPRLKTYPLYQFAKDKWEGITETSQPYDIATASGVLREVPDNGCLADYMSGAQMLAVVRANLAQAKITGATQTVVVGFHQETADDWIQHVRDFMDGVGELNAGKAQVEFIGMPQ